MEIQDRVAIVTGASTGIGRATAIALASAGARGVVLADINDLEETAAAVSKAGAEPLPVTTDVGDMDSLRALFAKTDEVFGALHILHNNAGMGEGQSVWPDVDPQRCASIIDVNLTGVVLGTQFALEPMKRSGGGVVVNTASGGAFIPLPPQAIYVATKAGVVHFTRSCAPLAESHGVRVNCVCPGLVDTPMVWGTGGGDQAADWLKPVLDGVTLLEPSDIASTVLDFVRDDSKIADVVTVENQPAG